MEMYEICIVDVNLKMGWTRLIFSKKIHIWIVSIIFCGKYTCETQ